MIGITTLTWIIANRNKLIKAIIGLSVGVLLAWGITLSKQNKKLSESLEMALNNIEAYLGSLLGSLLANNVLLLTVDLLKSANDDILHELDSVRNELGIKLKQLKSAATQKLIVYVNDGKEVLVNLLEVLKDTTYTDSILYNNLTKVFYTIGKDTVNVGIRLENTQYIFRYETKQYKNKKSFLKRLFTLDFKKVHKYKYKIENTNDLIKTDDVRVVEIHL